MSTRERKLVMLLAVFGLFGLLFGAYQLVWQPIQDGKKKLAELRDDLGEKQEKLEKYQKDRRRLDAAKKRSLPANPEDARREYEAVLGRLLRSAGVTAPNVVPKDNPDTQRIPQIEEANGRKRPAYSRVGFEITLKKVDLPTVAKFLEGYYGLNLLQQITHFEIKRTDAEIAQAGRRGAATGDRTDLEVKLVTEAIILDGAENRKTLLPVPTGVAAVGGWAGYQTVLNTPVAGRGIAPPTVGGPVLSTAGRDYLALAAKDVFHGPLPPPRTEVAAKPPEPPLAPKDDISPFIELTSVTGSSNGSYEAVIRDKSRNYDYKIELRPNAGKYEVRVRKVFYVDWKDKLLDRTDDLVIHEDDSSTNRTFKVVGLEGDRALVLTEVVTADPAKKGEPKKDEKKGSPRKQPGGGKGPPKSGGAAAPANGTTPVAAVAGAAAAEEGKPATEERVFVWRIGQTLKEIQPLKASEAQEVLRKVGAKVPGALAETRPTADAVSKAD